MAGRLSVLLELTRESRQAARRANLFWLLKDGLMLACRAERSTLSEMTNPKNSGSRSPSSYRALQAVSYVMIGLPVVTFAALSILVRVHLAQSHLR